MGLIEPINVWIDNDFVYTLSPNELTEKFKTKSGHHSFFAETTDKKFFWSDDRTVIDCQTDVVTIQ